MQISAKLPQRFPAWHSSQRQLLLFKCQMAVIQLVKIHFPWVHINKLNVLPAWCHWEVILRFSLEWLQVVHLTVQEEEKADVTVLLGPESSSKLVSEETGLRVDGSNAREGHNCVKQHENRCKMVFNPLVPPYLGAVCWHMMSGNHFGTSWDF